MKYDFTYMDFIESMFRQLGYSNPKDGFEVQQIALYDTDEDSLTERERFIMILTTIKYELEHDMLTPELKDELDLYYEEVHEGKFDGKLDEDEEEKVLSDLDEFYNKVFGKQ